MKTKTVVAILADYPVWRINSGISHKGWHYAVWLESVHENFPQMESFEIHWITSSRDVPKRCDFQCNAQFFHVFPAFSLTLSGMTHFIWDRIRIGLFLKKLKPDIVHAWGTEHRYALCAAGSSAKKILSMQGILTAYHRRCPMGAYFRRQVRLEVPTMRKFDIITSESIWGCERCRELVPDADIRQWEYAANPYFNRIKRHITDKPQFLMAGTADSRKNTFAVIEAFRRPELSHIKLLIAGLKQDYQPQLPPNVLALGGVSHEKIGDLLAGSWGLIHPSLADTSPNIVKEARVVGIPVIVSTECGGTQYVVNGKSGYIIEPHDMDAMVRGVLDIASSAERSLKMGAYGHEDCLRLLSVSTMLDGLQRLYNSLLDS